MLASHRFVQISPSLFMGEGFGVGVSQKEEMRKHRGHRGCLGLVQKYRTSLVGANLRSSVDFQIVGRGRLTESPLQIDLIRSA